MADKIDYKAYLSQFGKIETDAKNRIKAYLEEQIKEDAALRELYRPEKIDDCYDFIKNAVQASGCGSSAAVEDAIVFKMARDYYLDILPKTADEPPEVKSTGAETAEEAETEAETEPVAETEDTSAQADNENSGTPCEEAEPENEKPAEEVMLHQADETEGKESAESENSEAETEPAATENQPADNENEVVRDKYGFEIFGEEPETVLQMAERNVSEVAAACGRHGAETAEEPCHQDEVGTDVEDLTAGVRFDSGLIIDRPGRRLMFCDLFRGMHFVHADDENTHLYLVVCEVTYIDDNRIRFRIGNDNDFSCRKEDIDGEHRYCDQWLYAIPSDAKAVGKLVDDVRTELDEEVTVPSYDSEGNGLLFGF